MRLLGFVSLFAVVVLTASSCTGQQSKPNPGGDPLETAEPNVPENKPAFPEQTRAAGVITRAKFKVTEVAAGFSLPWAVAFLPDGRMLVTEKHSGKLFIVTSAGAKTEVSGVPKVDGHGQGGLLDVEVGPDYATSDLVYF